MKSAFWTAALLAIALTPCVRAEAQPAPRHPAPCSEAQLTLRLDGENGAFDGMSHAGGLLILRNLGPRACAMPSRPKLVFEDAQHRPLAISLQASPGMHPGPVLLPVAIPVDAEVTARMRWVSSDAYGAHNCVAPAFLTLPIGKESLRVPFKGQFCGPAGQEPRYSLALLTRDPVFVPQSGFR
jgi:hypothetical protein